MNIILKPEKTCFSGFQASAELQIQSKILKPLMRQLYGQRITKDKIRLR